MPRDVVPRLDVELVEHTPGSPHSGIGRYTEELRRRLAERVSLRVTTHADPPLTRYVSFLHHLPVGIRDHRPGSLVHFVEDLGCSQMLWRPVRPAVATSHDLGWLAWPPEATMHRPIDRRIWQLSYLGLRRMDAVITVSKYARNALIELLKIPPDRVTAVQSGIDLDRFRPGAEPRAALLAGYGLPDGPDDRYLLYVGTEIPRKNLDTLLRAMARLPRNVRLLKVGTPGAPRFRRATEATVRALGLGDRVTMAGDVSNEDLVRFYRAADAYICPSHLEGFGHPVLEAMACGTPVICSDGGALPEVVGDAAIVVAASDEQGFADAIRAVLDVDGALRRELAARGLRRAAEFSWDRTADGVLDVYERVVSDGTAAGPQGRRSARTARRRMRRSSGC